MMTHGESSRERRERGKRENTRLQLNEKLERGRRRRERKGRGKSEKIRAF